MSSAYREHILSARRARMTGAWIVVRPLAVCQLRINRLSVFA